MKYDVVTIIDQIGEYTTTQLKNGNKFCPYWFATNKDRLMGYRDIDWGPNMPHSETLGKLTEAMLDDGVTVYEWEEDKSNCLLLEGGAIAEIPPDHKSLGYYHIRAGSSPAYLLATREYGDRKTYDDYINNQPKVEYLRQMAWYIWMDHSIPDSKFFNQESFLKRLDARAELFKDCEVTGWSEYMWKFKEFHGLE